MDGLVHKRAGACWATQGIKIDLHPWKTLIVGVAQKKEKVICLRQCAATLGKDGGKRRVNVSCIAILVWIAR